MRERGHHLITKVVLKHMDRVFSHLKENSRDVEGLLGSGLWIEDRGFVSMILPTINIHCQGCNLKDLMVATNVETVHKHSPMLPVPAMNKE